MAEDTSAQVAAEDTTVETPQGSAHEAVLAPLRAKHGDVAYWDVPGFGLVVAAAPGNPAEYDRLVNTLKKDDADAAAALRTFATQCLVRPSDHAAKTQLFRKYPAFALKVAARGQQICGSGIEELGKD